MSDTTDFEIPEDFGPQLDAYESALRGGGNPRLEDHLPPEGADYSSNLLQLLQVDLEMRLRRGEAVTAAGYLASFPQLALMGQALLPLIGEQELALAALEPYKAIFPAALGGKMLAKLGLTQATPDTNALIESTFKLLADNKVDYTIFWRRLCAFTPQSGHEPLRDLFFDRESFNAWALHYSELLTHESIGLEANSRAILMLKSNPKYVLRNHLGETAIRQAQAGDFSEVDNLLAILRQPFDEHPDSEHRAGFPPDWASTIAISCSS